MRGKKSREKAITGKEGGRCKKRKEKGKKTSKKKG